MANTRQRTLSYHRAEYFNDNRSNDDLGQYIREAAGKLTTVSERSIQRAGGYLMRMAYFRPETSNIDNRGYFLHLTFETPGEHASVVPRAPGGATEIQVTTIPPPNDAEFMDGDAFLYVNGNDVCVCVTAVTIGTVRYFLQAFFEAAKLHNEATVFDFLNAIDAQKFALIQSKGVKEIEIKASMYKASADYVRRKTQVVAALGGVTRHIKAIFGSEYDVTDDALRVAVTINVDKRHRSSGITLGHKHLEEIASNIIQNQIDDDDYTIILESGERIKPKELVLRRSVHIASIGKSVVRESAIDALSAYYSELRKTGQLEQ